MPHKRDGPAPGRPTPSQGQGDTRPASLPEARTPRKTSSGQPTSSHRRSRRRQGDLSWRGFAVRLYLTPGSAAAALYSFLKLAAQRYGLEVASVDEIHETKHEDR